LSISVFRMEQPLQSLLSAVAVSSTMPAATREAVAKAMSAGTRGAAPPKDLRGSDAGEDGDAAGGDDAGKDLRGGGAPRTNYDQPIATWCFCKKCNRVVTPGE